MPFIGNKPSAVPLTSADITDSIITSAKITDATIVNGDIANSTIALAKLSATGTPSASNFLRGDNSWNTPAAGAYVFLGETTASNVATVDLNGYFTSDYDYYQIYLDGLFGSTNDRAVRIQFATTGSYTIQTSGYYFSTIMVNGSSGASGAEADRGWNESSMKICVKNSSTSAQISSIVLNIYDPMGSNIKTFTSNWTGVNGNLTELYTGVTGGRWNTTTAITGIRFFMESGNITARKIKIYGIKNS